MFLKAAQGPSEWIAASLPPVIITSVSPLRILRTASAHRMVALAHAVARRSFGPFQTVNGSKGFRLPRLTISLGTVNGSPDRTFIAASARSASFDFVESPPIPGAQDDAASVRIEPPEILITLFGDRFGHQHGPRMR